MFPITLIFSAAPDLRHSGNFSLSDTAAYKKNLKDKLETQIMSAAKAGCKTLLLGAWGCGVFKNTPENIAEAYVEVLKLYQGHFEKIVVVIYNGERDQNWDVAWGQFLRELPERLRVVAHSVCAQVACAQNDPTHGRRRFLTENRYCGDNAEHQQYQRSCLHGENPTGIRAHPQCHRCTTELRHNCDAGC